MQGGLNVLESRPDHNSRRVRITARITSTKDFGTQMDQLSIVLLRMKPLTGAFSDLRCDIACDTGWLCL